MAIVYTYRGAIYVNLTNRCPCACGYCIKNKWSWKFRGHDLKLSREPSSEDVLAAIKKAAGETPGSPREVVFCGYGEPFMRFDVMKETAAALKKSGPRKVRVNTTGLGNVICGRDVLPEIAGLVDEIVVSVNADNPRDYDGINRPSVGEGRAFDEVMDFIRRAAAGGFKVVLTAVEFPGTDAGSVKKLAETLGVGFRPRPYLDEYEKN